MIVGPVKRSVAIEPPGMNAEERMTASMLQPGVKCGKRGSGDEYVAPDASSGGAHVKSERRPGLRVPYHTYSTSKSAVRGLAAFPTESSARSSTRYPPGASPDTGS